MAPVGLGLLGLWTVLYLLLRIVAVVADEFEAVTPRDNMQTANAQGECHLSNLFLHSLADDDGAAKPIDVRPVSGQTQSFEATLDYSMAGFHIQATASPPGACEVSEMSTAAIMLDPGDFTLAEVFVTAKQAQGTSLKSLRYLVNVSRLTGSETELGHVAVSGAYFVPGWKPDEREYTVFLNLEEDLVRFNCIKLDNGQALEMTAELEYAGTHIQARRLQALSEAPAKSNTVGEAQRVASLLMTTLDVGHSRVVQLQVTSADRSRAANYYFTVQRPACSQERRFFDGTSKVCTDICNEGFYGSSATGRCTRCLDPHCAVCVGRNCSLCFDKYELQSGACVLKGTGSGMAAFSQIQSGVTSYAQKHQAMMVILGASLGVIACACAASIFCAHGSVFKRRPRLLQDEDEDELQDFSYREDSYRA
ncbi:unnamed protein product [Symbiodinium natans]|uniref:Uncharacterized protein n=1 Tax=Symbiodinium natans TaxID=878477 RepID=A0A812QGV6_9DINO|nr:unnamed protein product [Symbiodinium natans]